MPGFDGTGPLGRGSLTGKGMGYCVIPVNELKENINNREVINMPRGDGTGPNGFGPMTGRGAGFCAGYDVPGYANPAAGRGRGFGRGRGWGRGRGFGFGRGWGRGFGRGYGGFGGYTPYAEPYYGNPYGADVTPQQEAGMLKDQAKAMQEEINAINERIGELESVSKESK